MITTIFVNPTQFGPKEDLDKYPRDLERDKGLAEEAGTDFLFVPTDDDMYPEGYQSFVNVEKLTLDLCGKSRPWHFKGVTTIVSKLFNITKPHYAVFGQKDAQQAFVIQRMTKDLNFDIEIVIAPIIREEDGLATSSRNKYLNPQERIEATILHHSLQMAKDLVDAGERNSSVIIDKMREMIDSTALSKIDYVEIVDTHKLQRVPVIQGQVLIALAVFIGNTRLLDNVIIEINDSN